MANIKILDGVEYYDFGLRDFHFNLSFFCFFLLVESLRCCLDTSDKLKSIREINRDLNPQWKYQPMITVIKPFVPQLPEFESTQQMKKGRKRC